MLSSLLLSFVLAVFVSKTLAECPNACSSHGKCGAYDMCICYRNWMANDCSERSCQFGLAHVDTPKGDLDASSGQLSSPDDDDLITNSFQWPYGTTEQYPNMVDTDGTELENTAHYYQECSNKGICDRTAGICNCLPGYEGSACQRASCPSNSAGVCSGHGVCNTISEIAAADNSNIYELWDKDITMGCVCDSGYTGADCSQRTCKVGYDPLYTNNNEYGTGYNPNTPRYSNFTYQIYTMQTSTPTVAGNYSLIFYDHTGEDWETDPIDISASCDDVINALEALPNNVIPYDSVSCYDFGSDTNFYSSKVQVSSDHNLHQIGDTNLRVHAHYTLTFQQNPGKLQQIEINRYLDGTRPTLYSDESSSTLSSYIYPNGFIGEDTDYVSDYCEGVQVTLKGCSADGTCSSNTDTSANLFFTFDGVSTAELKLLKSCVGGSDFDETNNAGDIYDWDYGSIQYPHLIKLVDASTGPISHICKKSDGDIADAWNGRCTYSNPAGFYAVMYYVTGSSMFKIFTRAGFDYSTTTPFYVFTTTGTLQLVSTYAGIYTTYAAESDAATMLTQYYQNTVYVSNVTRSTDTPYSFNGDLSCETNSALTSLYTCLDKDDMVMIINTGDPQGVNSNSETDVTTMGATWPITNEEDFNSNPKYPNIYRVKKIARVNRDTSTTSDLRRHKITLDYSMNTNYHFDAHYAAGATTVASSTDTTASIYKFTPPTGYNYVGECSNRGLCNYDTGVCQCFHGYTSDDCGTQNALAV